VGKFNMCKNPFEKIDSLISAGEFSKALVLTNKLFLTMGKLDDGKEKYLKIYNISAFYIDIGHFDKKIEICRKGLKLMDEHKSNLLKYLPKSRFYYNYANGLSNIVSVKLVKDLTFQNIEELIEVKNLYWKSFKENQDEDRYNPQLSVNLGNTLKRQYRITEALRNYDNAIDSDNKIYQAHTNKSESLRLLQEISHSYTYRQVKEIRKGYIEATKSNNIPKQYIKAYDYEVERCNKYLEYLGTENDEIDDKETKKEFDSLSKYRKYSILNRLTLNEHALYCQCIGAARDNLTIPLTSTSISGEFVPLMETYLNRIKSEFSLARLCFYEYHHHDENNMNDLQYENCFTELKNNELLGLPVEKLRTSFRLCFGILDKIARALNSLYNLNVKGNIYFHNFWRLDINNNREKFEKIKNPGLLSLYSIASDLNEYKNGEWACFKKWRNALEHEMLVIIDKDSVYLDPYKTLNKELITINIDDFIGFLEELLQLTRSAIFSFVFCVREEAIKRNEDSIGIKIPLKRKNYNKA